MKLQFIIRCLMALHIAGIVIMAGTTLVDYLTFKTFWKLAEHGDNRSLGLVPLMEKYGALIRAGAVTLMLTGLAMLILQKNDWTHQFWFKVKLVLFFLSLLNGMFVGNTLGHNFRKMVTSSVPDLPRHTMQVRKSLNLFYPVQLTFFFLTISVSMIQPGRTGSEC